MNHLLYAIYFLVLRCFFISDSGDGAVSGLDSHAASLPGSEVGSSGGILIDLLFNQAGCLLGASGQDRDNVPAFVGEHRELKHDGLLSFSTSWYAND